MYATMEQLLTTTKKRGASDLHVTVGVRPKIRLNGELVELPEYDVVEDEDAKELVYSMMKPKLKAEFDETGEADFSYSLPELGRFRVNAFKQRGYCGVVLRVISTKIPSPDKLGIPESVVNLSNCKRGLVLVTGPTGSGKSTTLASLIDVINTKKRVNIITLEDPIEYVHKHKMANVNQREIGFDSMSFGAGIRAAMREDPDIILVGEMRDLDTIATAITAAETGHLVFSTLHTIGAAETIDRIIDTFPPHQQTQIRVQLAAVLRCVISQQLIPTFDGKGRVAAFEVMHGTTAIANLIREAKTHQIDSSIQTGKKLGMVQMDEFIYDLYMRHKIDGAHAVEFAQDQEAMALQVY